MLKKLWAYLISPNYQTSQQIVGIRFLIVFALAVMLLPLAIHGLVPVKTSTESELELSRLKQLYVSKLDSLDKISIYKGSNYGSGRGFAFPAKNYSNSSSSYVSRPIVRFNLNTASIDQLTSVSGIGPVLADRILKYRTQLGGFYSQNQLYEVYGLDSTVVKQTFKHLEGVLEPSIRYKVNVEEFKVLLKHPYLEYKDVQVIFNNRPIGSKEMLCRLLPGTCQKVAPYLLYD